jgi:N-acetylmuramoyl-L-alanine amidase
MAKKLRAELLSKGYSVVMTRDDDKFPSLEDRANYCRKVKPDIYVSIHCNASRDQSVTGIETYCPTPAKAPSTGSSKPGYNAYSGNAFDKNNYRLAYEVQSALVEATKAVDKGVKHARFFVIKNASCPAILVETGFVSNPSEEMSLASGRRQAQTVSAIVSGIERYAKAVK